ncbi:D-tyrosyl-tRNA(Tyr) deacylase [Apibacter muscae]|uniref:D-aminoacyl-tRNA deacylase n=1 Tax=Apibacter muscae TaxID=2509004 RepID=A0A563DF91_9FLAO|nr:D-aminoacyl-tRNA deacylase [Apibacter muscae]TWP28739.1 D-tyrosyl-tRNA(Tyr) deacylase [Apibacter muscae]
MRVVLQRVREASVEVENRIVGEINQGLLVLLGVEDKDTEEDVEWLVRKIINLRIFNDPQGVMNLSVEDIQGGILIVSQFTLFASTKKGNRPSYQRASSNEFAYQMYLTFLQKLEHSFTGLVSSGRFGEDMKVSLMNDGPVTIFIDSQDRE